MIRTRFGLDVRSTSLLMRFSWSFMLIVRFGFERWGLLLGSMVEVCTYRRDFKVLSENFFLLLKVKER